MMLLTGGGNKKFLLSTGVCSWFSQLIQASSEFITDERVTMVEIEGIPLKVWNENTFIRIASKWGTLLNVENLEKNITLQKTISVGLQIWMIKNDDGSDSGRCRNVKKFFKKDFGEVMRDKMKNNKEASTKESLEYPPGFTPRENDVENVEMDNQKDNCDGEFGNVNNIFDEVNFSSGFNTYKKAGGESMDSDHCRESEGSRKGGSILMLMDELVKVGQTMGYNMDGCMKNIEEIIESQGVDGLKYLKKKIRVWNGMRQSPKTRKHVLKQELADLEMIIDKGDVSSDTLHKRAEVVKSIQEVDKLCAMEASQKAKIKWAIEGDENSKYYHDHFDRPKSGSVDAYNMVFPPSSEFMQTTGFEADSLSINLSKSKLLGVVVSEDRVVQAANRIGCGVIKGSLVIKAIHGEDGKNGSGFKVGYKSIWKILQVVDNIEDIQKRSEQDQLTGFTTVTWKVLFLCQTDRCFGEAGTQTRWIKAVPIKVNIHAWNVRMDCLPTHLNISWRGIDIPSILCPVCGSVMESSSHLLFDCLVAKDNFCKDLPLVGGGFSWEMVLDDLNGEGVFRVKEVRYTLDDIFLPSAPEATRWVKYIPIRLLSLLGVLGLIVSDRSNPFLVEGVDLASSLCRYVTRFLRL
ncbi:RNA-directed DNA polymerase, eukaryota [Tanacetum coccineum]